MFANGAVTAAMAYAFNQMTQRDASQQAEQLNNSRGPHKWTAVPLEDGTWNVMKIDEAAQRAAGLNPDTGGVASGSGQVGASGFFLAGGASVSAGVVADTNGNTCAFYSVCLQAGVGLGAGAGGAGALSVSEVQPGISWPEGPLCSEARGSLLRALQISSGKVARWISLVEALGSAVGTNGAFRTIMHVVAEIEL